MKWAIDEPLADLAETMNQVDTREGASAWNEGSTARKVDGHPLFARSPVMREFLDQAIHAFRTSPMLCLAGEEGTGRAVVARELHLNAGGAPDAFVLVECIGLDHAALDAAVFQSPLGAGVTTTYLSHVGDMPLETQARLARTVRELSSAQPGSKRRYFAASLDTSVVAAVEDGRVLRELADVLVSLDVPALRHRKLDIPLLGEHLLQEAALRLGTPPRVFSRAAASLISALPWSRNTPELSAFVDRLAAGVDRPVVELDDLLAHLRLATSRDHAEAGLTLRKAREEFERECISAALVKHRGRMADAAQALGIQRTNLYRKIRQLKVPRAGRPTTR